MVAAVTLAYGNFGSSTVLSLGFKVCVVIYIFALTVSVVICISAIRGAVSSIADVFCHWFAVSVVCYISATMTSDSAPGLAVSAVPCI